MKIEQIAIDSLILDPSNARKHNKKNLESIKGSLAKFGAQKPIVVDENNVVVAGNGTLEAARELGWKSIAAVRTALKGSDKTAFALADNRTTDLSEWDDDVLGKQLQALYEEGYAIDEIGFDPDEYEIKEETTGNIEDDEIPETKENEFNVQRGQIWQLGEHRIMCGDSTCKEDVDRLMAGEKADMVFTDPPYGVDYKGIKNDSRSGLYDLLHKSFKNLKTLSLPGSPVYVFHSDRCADIFRKVFDEFCHFSSMLIWDKKSLTLSQTDYQSRHEPCMYGWMNGDTHKFYGDRKNVSVVEIKREQIEGHTTPKPVEFIVMALHNSSKIEGKIIDLFLGSGSTLIACEKTNRKCYGMEIDPHYCSVIIKRWQDFTGKTASLVNGK